MSFDALTVVSFGFILNAVMFGFGIIIGASLRKRD